MMSATSTTERTGIHTIARPQPDRTNAPEMIRGPLRVSAIDEGANGGMRHNADEATGREHGADRGLAPLCLCEQVNVHIGAEAAAHIGEEEIEPVAAKDARRKRGLIAAEGSSPFAG
jgi:hypothetical protein